MNTARAFVKYLTSERDALGANRYFTDSRLVRQKHISHSALKIAAPISAVGWKNSVAI